MARARICEYSVVVSGEEIECGRLLNHKGPCLGKIPGGRSWHVWCARTCRGCVKHGHPDDMVKVQTFTGDHEAVSAGVLEIKCLL